jgi:AcrR family transcriptional regulator
LKATRLPRGPHALPPADAAARQRERLVEATPRVVAEHGYNAMTVAHIVAAAGVGRAAFYQQFSDKHACFAVAHERAQERVMGVLTFPCYTKAALAERVEASLSAALGFLAREQDLAALLVVEGPAAGGEIARRQLEWMKRCGALLRLASVGAADARKPQPDAELLIVGGIAAGIAQKILAGETARLSELTPSLVDFTLSCYARSR